LEIGRRVAEELRREREHTNVSEPTRPPHGIPKTVAPEITAPKPGVTFTGDRHKTPKSS
jgi:hypothetical protein